MLETCPRCGEYVEGPKDLNSDFGRSVKCEARGLEGDVGVLWEPYKEETNV